MKLKKNQFHKLFQKNKQQLKERGLNLINKKSQLKKGYE